MKYELTNQGQSVSLPATVIQNKIEQATETELKVLLYIITLADGNSVFTASDIQEISSLELEDIISALQFWRGAGVLKIAGKSEKALPEHQQQKAETKALQKYDIPTYSGEEIARLFDENGEIKLLIEECQKIAGKIFNTHESNKIVALYDYLGLSAEYILSVYNYCKNKNKTTVHYLEKTVFNLYNEGVDSDEKLRDYLKAKEEFDSISGKIRRIFGIGTRSLTKKEEEIIKKWSSSYNFSPELIEYAYEITVNTTGKPSLPYANKILENWYNSGVTTVTQAKEQGFEYKKTKHEAQAPASFDNDEFFNIAIQNSYNNLGKKPKG